MTKQSRMKKNLAGGVIALSAMVLVACGSPKEDYLDAQSKIEKADTLESSTIIKIEPSKDGELKELFDVVEISALVMSDNKSGLHEIDLGINAGMGAVSLDVALPMFVDNNANKIYTKSEGYAEIMNTTTMFMGSPLTIEIPDELEGKIVEISIEDEEELDADTVEMQEALTKALQESLQTTMKDIPKESFNDDKGTVSYTMDGQKLVDSVFDALIKSEVFDSNVETDTETLEYELGGIQEIDLVDIQRQFAEVVHVGDVNVTSVIEGGKIIKEELIVPVTFKDGDVSEVITLTVVNEYRNYNGKVDFTFDITDENVITQEAFEEALSEQMSNGFDMEFDESDFDFEEVE